MDLEKVRDYCLSLPLATEDMAFGDEYLLFRVCDRIFACVGLVRPDYFVVKADAGLAIEWRERYAEIEPAWNWNKKYWNQISLTGSLTPEMIRQLIRHSYSEVVKKLPRRVRTLHPEISAVGMQSAL